MAPIEKVDFIYLYLTYVPARETEKFNEVYKQYGNHQLSAYLSKYRSWLDPIAFYEKSKLKIEAPMCYTEYRIHSNNLDLFTIFGKKFDKILIVLGDHAVYWQYFMDDELKRKKIQGKGKISLTYCACCIREQYENILKNIKSYVQKKDSTNKN